MNYVTLRSCSLILLCLSHYRSIGHSYLCLFASLHNRTNAAIRWSVNRIVSTYEEEAFNETDHEMGLEGDADTFWEPEYESNSELSDTEEPSTSTSSQSQSDLSTRREVHSTLFGFHDDLTLCSYVSKKSKAVVVLSSMHHDDIIDEGELKKPEMILFYNKTKGGVDTNDKLCSTYNVARRTKRWPMVIFFHLFNVSAINAFVIYNFNNNEATIRRRIFLKLLSTELVKAHRLARAIVPSLPSALKKRLSKPEAATPSTSNTGLHPAKRGRCYICPRKGDRKTTAKCNKCNNFICGDHTKKICDNC
ncbi:unnamed protein product [Parnassius mnemosyne]|uniref:PiggyBac transposable element-derived protein domain-containing protein n=1 Tax=Parnassius mnemosyne TaxID=213953 RepID=A0AAV1LVW8_9NEOP